MLYALICNDKIDSLHVRMEARPAHLLYLESLGEALKGAGPFTDDDGKAVGSLVIIDAPSRSAAEAIAARDPYAQAGLFLSVEIRPWKWLIKNPESA